VLAEIHDGLTDAIDSHRAADCRTDAAAGAAIAEFGDPATVARSYRHRTGHRFRPAHYRPRS
jgi:hypothetical protein